MIAQRGLGTASPGFHELKRDFMAWLATHHSLKSPLCSCVSITLRVLSLFGVPIRNDNERYAQSQRTKGNQ